MTELLLLSVAVFAYALVSKRLSTSPITAPMVFTGIGLLVGTAGLDWFDVALEGGGVDVLVEVTLVLVLFTDATRIDIGSLRMEAGIPARLLAIGMPLTIIAGAATAVLVFDQFTWQEGALLAAVLAPTDAALGQAVVGDGRLPATIRQSLNTESGLNDGIALPVVTLLIGVVAMEGTGAGAPALVEFLSRQLGFGVVIGIAVGSLGGWLLSHRAGNNRVTGIYRQLATLAIAAGAFAGAEVLEGNGFIAAFVAGISLRRVAEDECAGIEDFTEDEGTLLMAVTFVVFGAVIAGSLLDGLTPRAWLYAVASLTVIRIVPVLVSLVGSGTYLETRLFLGWFGPRGLASILFALLVLEQIATPTGDAIAGVAVATVVLSVYAHGLTASPWAGRLARKLRAGPDTMPELMPTRDSPPRWSSND